MRTEVTVINGQSYTLTSATDEGKNMVWLNGMAAETVYYNQQYTILFAPFRLPEGDFWFTVYNNTKIRLFRAEGNLDEGSFIEHYCKKAYNPVFSFLYIAFLILAPSVLLNLIGPDSVSLFNIVCVCLGTMYFYIVNAVPFASRKKRRIICLGSLVLVALQAVVTFLPFWS